MQVMSTSTVDWLPVEHNVRGGRVDFKLVREAELLPGVNSSTMLIKYHEAEDVFTAPRHHHDFEQIRVALSGRQDYGSGDIAEAGWVAYFPAGAFYGPEVIRGASILLVQWSDFWVTREQNNRAIEELRKLGEFKGGVYTYVDSDGKPKKKDGLNAVWEHVYKRPSSFPTPKYPSPILMNPDAFEWVKRDDVLSEKMLGRFTERDLILSKIRWDVDGRYELPADRTYCVFTLSGSVRVNGVNYGPETAVWSDFGEKGSLEGEAGTEAFSLAFPPGAFARHNVEGASKVMA
jgi:hypothetical protein